MKRSATECLHIRLRGGGGERERNPLYGAANATARGLQPTSFAVPNLRDDFTCALFGKGDMQKWLIDR